VSATVTLPPGVSYVGIDSGGSIAAAAAGAHPVRSSEWICEARGSTVDCDRPSLPGGRTTTLLLDVDAAVGSAGDVPVRVTVSARGLDPVTVTSEHGVLAAGLAAVYAANGHLAVTEVGNALLSCPAAAPGCADARLRMGQRLDDDDWDMAPYDADGDPTTTESSAVGLDLPSGSTVVWAGLYWSGSWTGSPGETLFQRFPVKQFHDEKRRALILPDVVERADMGVRELRERACFAIEALTKLRIGGEPGLQHLDGDGAIEPRVAGLVDLAHAARAQRGQDFVRTETVAGSEGQPLDYMGLTTLPRTTPPDDA